MGLDYDIDDNPGETTSKSVKEQKKTEEIWKNKRQNKNTTRISTITCSNNTDNIPKKENERQAPKEDENQRRKKMITKRKRQASVIENQRKK
jgi:hypothetical protein